MNSHSVDFIAKAPNKLGLCVGGFTRYRKSSCNNVEYVLRWGFLFNTAKMFIHQFLKSDWVGVNSTIVFSVNSAL